SRRCRSRIRANRRPASGSCSRATCRARSTRRRAAAFTRAAATRPMCVGRSSPRSSTTATGTSRPAITRLTWTRRRTPARALPNIVLSPRAVFRMRQVLARERFDLLHVHEPMTPAIGVAALSFARVPLVATFHASGELAWMKLATPVWGFLAERLDHRIAVSQDAADSACRYLPGAYEVIPNGVVMPEVADPGGRENRIVFVGRHEPRKGLHVLLSAWPEIRRQTGARLRIVGADPLQVRLLLTRHRIPDEGIDALGFVSEQERT